MKKNFLFRLTALIITLCMAVSSAGILSYATEKPSAGVYVTDYALNFRDAPTTGGNKVALIPVSTKITVTSVTADTSGEHTDWYWGYTSYNGVKGYACLAYCTAASATTTSSKPVVDSTKMTTGLYKVNANSINMRNGAGTSYGRLTYIPGGKILKVTEITLDSDGYSWGKTNYQSKDGTFEGYVRLDNCEKFTMPSMTTDDINGSDSVNWKAVDISTWQTEDQMDWDALKADGTNCVILKIGGTYTGGSNVHYPDTSFYIHYINARAAGMHIGCYFYSYALNTAKAVEEAEYVLDLINDYGCDFDLPVYIDIEEADGKYDHWKLGKTACTSIVNSFCETIENAGYYAGIYASKSFACDLISNSAFTGRSTWIAQYNTECTYPYSYDMWQYTQYGTTTGFTPIKGVCSYIDISHCYVNLPKIIAAKYGTTAEETTTKKAAETTTAKKTEETTTQTVTTTKAETTTALPPVNIVTTTKPADGQWTATVSATCTTDGTQVLYLNGQAAEEKVLTKNHSDIVECILGNTSIEISAGQIIDSDVFSANFTASDSPYYKNAVAAMKSDGGVYAKYCRDCGEIIEIQRTIKTNNCAHSTTTQTTAATCKKEGLTKVVCSKCGVATYEKIIERTEHTAESTATLCWQVSQPYTETKCSKCSAVIDKKYISNGDIDYDGTVSVADARTVLRVAVKIDMSQIYYIKLGDMDSDNALTVNDARLILRKAVKLD